MLVTTRNQLVTPGHTSPHPAAACSGCLSVAIRSFASPSKVFSFFSFEPIHSLYPEICLSHPQRAFRIRVHKSGIARCYIPILLCWEMRKTAAAAAASGTSGMMGWDLGCEVGHYVGCWVTCAESSVTVVLRANIPNLTWQTEVWVLSCLLVVYGVDFWVTALFSRGGWGGGCAIDAIRR